MTTPTPQSNTPLGNNNQNPQTPAQPAAPQYQAPNAQQPQYVQPAAPAKKDSGSAGWGVLGFFIPLVGLILFLVWRISKPKSAKVAGIGAIIGFCLSLVYYIIRAVVASKAATAGLILPF